MNRRTLTPILDTLFCLLMTFIAIVMLLRVTQNDSQPAFQQNAVYLLVLQWEGNDDVDLWARDPHGRLVGFNRREGGEGSLFSLNRDNLGTYVTEMNAETGKAVSKVNEEIIMLRGTFEGEYVLASHMYTKRDPAPTKVTAKLLRVKPHGELQVKERTLERTGDQQTFFRFHVDKEGKVIGFNELPTSLFAPSEN